MTWTAYRTTSKWLSDRRKLSQTAMLLHYDTKVPQNAVLVLKSLGTMANIALKHYAGASSDLTSEHA